MKIYIEDYGWCQVLRRNPDQTLRVRINVGGGYYATMDTCPNPKPRTEDPDTLVHQIRAKQNYD